MQPTSKMPTGKPRSASVPTTKPKHRVGQRVFWQGQDGECNGIVTRITEPEPENFTLFVDINSGPNNPQWSDFPIGDAEVTDTPNSLTERLATVWDRTLDEYEKSISHGDTKGAAILRALILEKLKSQQPTTCGFCGKSFSECECPNPM
jgi:hypothetical protein